MRVDDEPHDSVLVDAPNLPHPPDKTIQAIEMAVGYVRQMMPGVNRVEFFSEDN